MIETAAAASAAATAASASSAITTQTTVSDTDSIAVVISSAMGSSASEKDKITIILNALTDKLIDMLPAIGMAIITFIIGIAVSKVLLRVIHKLLHKSQVDNAAGDFLTSIIKVVLYVTVLIITLSLLNIPMTSLIAVLSAAGLAIGLALQNSLSNVAGGFIILFNKPFKSGDYIETNSAAGTVESISILYTKIVTLDNKTVYIPNGSVSGNVIVNFSAKDIRRIDLEFGISYSDDLEFAKQLIKDIAKSHEKVLDAPQTLVRLCEQASDSLQIRVEVWVKTADYWQVRYDMTELVNAAFNENGVTVPFRQLDVHIN